MMDEIADRRQLDFDMGDDEQEDEILLYERYIEDPPSNLVIREPDDQEPPGISSALQREWTRRGQLHEEYEEDERCAEEAAVEVETEEELETRTIE